jgi:hypothetical protein
VRDGLADQRVGNFHGAAILGCVAELSQRICADYTSRSPKEITVWQWIREIFGWATASRAVGDDFVVGWDGLILPRYGLESLDSFPRSKVKVHPMQRGTIIKHHGSWTLVYFDVRVVGRTKACARLQEVGSHQR